jgi:hypothetical protein
MPWFRHLIDHRIFQPDPTGPFRMRLKAVVPIELERTPGVWIPVLDAILDTGASFCTFSAAWARQHQFQLPPTSSALPVVTAAGRRPARVYDVDLNARFRRMPEYPFSLAVVCSDAHPSNVPPLIGLHNLLNYWRYTFDGSDDPIAITGHMRFETL